MTTKPVTVIKKDDPIMLKQQILFLKSELARYTNQVKEYQNNYHYSMIEKLKEENVLLKEEIETLRAESEIETETLRSENDELKAKLSQFDGNSDAFLSELLSEKEAYMEKWEVLKEELYKIVRDQVPMQNDLYNEEDLEKSGNNDTDNNAELELNLMNQKNEDVGTEWFLNNIKSLKQKK